MIPRISYGTNSAGENIKWLESPDYNYVFNAKSGFFARWGKTKEEDPYGESHIDASTAAGYVWDQIKNQKPMTKKKVVEEIGSGYYDGHPEFPFDGEDTKIQEEYRQLTGKNIHDSSTPKEWKDRLQTAWKKKMDDYDEANKEAAATLSERLLKSVFDGKKLFNCSFSDNDGPVGCTMEHGGTFNHIPHTVISHH